MIFYSLYEINNILVDIIHQIMYLIYQINLDYFWESFNLWRLLLIIAIYC